MCEVQTKAEATDIYEIVANFTIEDWRKFARTKLKLNEFEEIESKFSGDLSEVKLQCVRRWENDVKLSNEEVCKKLRILKHQYFCGNYDNQVEIFPEDSSRVAEATEDRMILQDDNNAATGGENNHNQPRTDDAFIAIPPPDTPGNSPVDDIYPLDGKRGCVLIISNSFDKTEHARRGSDFDLYKMEELWKNDLRCELMENKVHGDKTADEMNALFYKMSQLKKNKYSFLVIVIMTHGDRIQYPDTKNTVDVVYGNDLNFVVKTDIEGYFRNDNADQLKGIPKLFIYQSCRGKHHMIATTPARPNIGTEKIEPFASIPDICDILVIHSSHPRYSSYRFHDSGSWLILAIYDIFRKYARSEHVVDMLTRVNREIWKKEGRLATGESSSSTLNVKSMSIFESSLIKKFYFFEQIDKQ